jgi:hypothetical protein
MNIFITAAKTSFIGSFEEINEESQKETNPDHASEPIHPRKKVSRQSFQTKRDLCFLRIAAILSGSPR